MEGESRLQKGAAQGAIGHNSDSLEERRANLYHAKKDRVFVQIGRAHV